MSSLSKIQAELELLFSDMTTDPPDPAKHIAEIARGFVNDIKPGPCLLGTAYEESQFHARDDMTKGGEDDAADDKTNVEEDDAAAEGSSMFLPTRCHSDSRY
jgi:hypothetical protein